MLRGRHQVFRSILSELINIYSPYEVDQFAKIHVLFEVKLGEN